MKLDYGKIFYTVDYKDSNLSHYLKFDNWDLLDGLLLLVGLSPEDTIVTREPNHVGKTYTVKNLSILFKVNNYKIPKLLLDNFQPLDTSQSFSIFYGEFIKHNSYSAAAKTLSLITYKKNNEADVKDALAKIYLVKEYYEKKFHDLIGLWFSGDHWNIEQDRYLVKDFIKWAEKKEIEIPWLDWAKVKGLIETAKTIDTRKEKTYQIIIGALLEFIKGDAPGTDAHPNFKSEAKMIELFDSYGLPGLSKSTLERRLSEAKKALKSEI